MSFDYCIAQGNHLAEIMQNLNTQVRKLNQAKLCIAIVSPKFSPQSISIEMNQLLGPIPWIGCYSPFIFTDHERIESGVALIFLTDPRVQWGMGMTTQLDSSPHKAGELAMRMALDKLKNTENQLFHWVFLNAAFSAPDKLIQGCVQEAGSGHQWFGGAFHGANDSTEGLFALGKYFSNSVIILSMKLNKPFQLCNQLKWRAFPHNFRITQTVPLELNFRNAAEIYAEFMPNKENLNHFTETHPLGIQDIFGNTILRSLRLNDHNELMSQGPLEEGMQVQILEANSNKSVFPGKKQSLRLHSQFLADLPAQDAFPGLGCMSFAEIHASPQGIPFLQMGSHSVLEYPHDS